MTTSSSSPSPGSNLSCHHDTAAENAQRIRREWDHLDSYDRALYLDAVETAIERGLHTRFAAYHCDTTAEIQAHDTCAFYPWHRLFILAYENMLRSLEPRFACLTLPFWDLHRDYAKQQSSSHACRSYGTCSRMINDLGGLVANDELEERTFFGQSSGSEGGWWHFGPPVQNLRDDHNHAGIVRYDVWYDPIPSEAGILRVENVARLFAKKNRIDFWEALHHGVHDAVHDTLGGFMRTPASVVDPLFMPWHSTMDLFDYIWEACHSSATGNDTTAMLFHYDANRDKEKCTYSTKAEKFFPNFSLSQDEAYMILDNTTDVRKDPYIGQFFSQPLELAGQWKIANLDVHHRFRYTNIPENFHEALENNPQACPNGLGAILNDAEGKGASDEHPLTYRQPPDFSDEELRACKEDWMDQAQVYYAAIDAAVTLETKTPSPQVAHSPLVASNPNPSTSKKMEFVRCILFEAMDRDTIERWAIDSNAFLTQVVQNQRYDTHPMCRWLLSAAPVGIPDTTTHHKPLPKDPSSPPFHLSENIFHTPDGDITHSHAPSAHRGGTGESASLFCVGSMIVVLIYLLS